MIVVSVDDDEKARNFVTKVLQKQKYTVLNFDNALEAIDYVRTHGADVALVDYDLGGGPDGLHLARQIRTLSKTCVIIMITEYGGLQEAVQAMRIGTDDFLLKKELTPEILLQRIGEDIMQRKMLYPPPEPSNRRVGDLEMDLARRTATWHGEPLRLTASQFALLAQLTSKPGRVFPYGELYALCSGEHLSAQDARSKLKSHITNIRNKLEQGGRYKQTILNHYGVGFKWDDNPDEAAQPIDDPLPEEARANNGS